MNSRQLRLLRAAAAVSLATVIAAVSHTFGGGAAPHPLLVALAIVFLTPVAAALIGRPGGKARVAATVIFAQGAFHLLFHFLAVTTNSQAVGGHHHHHIDVASLGLLAHAHGLTGPMVLAHVAAAIVTTALIWHGESLIFGVVRWVRARLRRVPLSPRHPFAHPALGVSLIAVIARVSHDTISERGPPGISRLFPVLTA